jgi:riboflavin biosynthesis pyrimidine reductase
MVESEIPRMSDDEIAAAYAWSSGRTSQQVRANMITSLDGGAALEGRAGGMGSADDQRVLTILRDLSDVVLVGAGTIRAEGYGGIRLNAERLERRRRWGLGVQPPLAVVTARGLAADTPIFVDTPVPPLVITTADGARRMKDVAATVIIAGDASIEPDVMLAALADRDMSRVLCEGGPSLLGRLAAADRLDELCLTASPMLLGGRPLTLLAGTELSAPVRWKLETVLRSESFLFTRHVRPAVGE